ncbi:MAG: aromatic amino acid ammonia-lyase [Advenella sp.]|uniref:aromatic amino acid ammonia-lyase n=1 Tax=Advenella sp. S44 TaxID=1982755 RepID=UPI001374781F|nr:aromatic amino acid ammonia-lyase [Advenella sp. S44]
MGNEVNSKVDIDGRSLSVESVLRVARQGATVGVPPLAWEQIRSGREVVERLVSRGDLVYGVTSSVGAKTGVLLDPEHYTEFNWRLLETHNFGHGPTASPEVVRSMLVILLNSMASGRLGVRPILAEKIVDALNSDRHFTVHLWGSTGESDMSPVVDIVLDLYDDVQLAAGEAIALINSSALSIGSAALAIYDIEQLLHNGCVVAALSMEGFAANPSILSDAAVRSRPFEGLALATRLIKNELEGSYLYKEHGPRHLQDPLCFRSLPITYGNAFDVLDFAKKQIGIELNASQNNPVVSIEDDAMVSVANFDMLSLSMALDALRLALAPVVTGSTERLAKLVDSYWSGLSIGLINADELGLPGFNGLAQVHKSLTSEARLLAAPSVNELASSSHSNGNLDRVSMASLSARRSMEMATLSKSILAFELQVAAQAVEMREVQTMLGANTTKVFRFVRSLLPFAGGSQRVPHPAPLMDALEKIDYDLHRILCPLRATEYREAI